jgi:hypothetical protein
VCEFVKFCQFRSAAAFLFLSADGTVELAEALYIIMFAVSKMFTDLLK